MAIKSEYLGGASDWEDGGVLNATDLLDTIEITKDKIVSLYEGDGFNVSVGPTNAASSDTDDYEFSEITSTDLEYRTYLIIDLTASIGSNNDGSNSATANVKIYIKEVGGAYVLKKTLSSQRNQNNKYIYTLTAGDKTNGIQVKLEGNASTTGGGSSDYASASVTNEQVLLTLK
jgi:hypothetical protein